MAAGMLTKQADFLTAKYLNTVNDSVAGGAIVSLPAGLTGPQVSQTQPGDRIVLDDISALALSNPAVQRLYAGVYQYAQALITTRAIVLGGLAFWTLAGLVTTPGGIIAASDAQPTTALPGLFAGVWINVITTGNYGWIQVAGIASVLFDSAVTATTPGNAVTAKVSSTVASTADNGATVSQATVAALIGVSINTVTASTVSQVMMTRGWLR